MNTGSGKKNFFSYIITFCNNNSHLASFIKKLSSKFCDALLSIREEHKG